MHRLANLFAELETDIARCSKCGMCQSVCPLYAQTRNENDVARGKLALLDAIGHEMFDRPDGVIERLNRCLLCGACAANCPNGVDGMAIFLKARAILSEFAGLSPIKKFLFKRILANPGAFEKWVKRGSKIQKWIIQPENKSLGTTSMRFTSVLGKRHFLPLADTPFYERVSKQPAWTDDKSSKVLFFPGCLINHVFPNVGLAALDVLSYHDMSFRIPDCHICCGMPAVSAGETETAKKLILQNLEELQQFQFDDIVTACPTCAYAMREVWPMMVKAVDMDRKLAVVLEHVMHHTLDISQFVYAHCRIAANSRNPEPCAKTVTYHDPCHLKKSLGVHKAPRAMIAANPGYRLAEMKQADRCCGMGGSFGVEHFEISDKIGDAKLANILATNCDVVSSGCPACMLQLVHLLSKTGSTITVKHPVEIYAEKIIK